MATPNHTIGPAPLTAASITDTSAAVIANLLHRMQARYTGEYLLDIAANGRYSDSDYDYLGGALDASQALLALSYDGSANDLRTWLFGHADSNGMFGIALAGLAGDCLCPLLAAIYHDHWR